MRIDRNLTPTPDANLPEGYYRVIFRPNPFQETAIFAQFHTSQNLAEVIDRLQIPWADQAEAFIEGTHVPREHWAKVRPNAGVEVQIRTAMGVEGVVAVLSSISGSWAASTAAKILSIEATSFLATAIGAVATGLVTYGLNKMFGIGETKEYKDDLNADIRGARNVADIYGAVPVVLGTHRMAPLYGGNPYTETVAGARFLRMLMVWGYGPVEVSNIRLGEQALGKFGIEDDGIENDYAGTQSKLDLYPKDADQQAFNIELTTPDDKDGPPVYWLRTTAVDTTSLHIGITMPSGIYLLDSKNKRVAHKVYLSAQYRKVGAASWTDWFIDEQFPGKKTATGSALYFQRRVTGLTEGKYEVRVWRPGKVIVSETVETETGTVTRDVDFKNVAGKQYTKLTGKRNDATYWTDLVSFGQGRPVLMDGVAKSAYRIKANEQLQGVVDQMTGLVSLKVTKWNGSAWSGVGTTSNPAALFRWVLMGPANGAPLSSSRINGDELGAWYEYCENKGLEYNKIVSSRTSVKDMITEIAAAGHASPTVVDNKWSVIIDKPQSVVRQHFTPRNSWGFSSRILFPDIPHALRIRFINENADYVEDERVVYDEGYTAATATKFQVITLPGLTKPGLAWKQGRRIMKSMRLRPEVFEFYTDVEGLIAQRGDLIRFSHDVAKIGTGYGRVTEVVGNRIYTDEVLTVQSGRTYTFRFRKGGGATDVYNWTATTTAEKNSFAIAGLDGVAAGQMFMFGPEARESVELLVDAIEPGDDFTMKLTCVPYQESLYDPQDDPDYETVITTPKVLALIGPSQPLIRSLVSDERALISTSNGGLVPSIRVLLKDRAEVDGARSVVTSYFRVRYRETADSADTVRPWTYTADTPVDAALVVIQGVEQGVAYDVQAQAVSENGVTSTWATANNHLVLGALANPPDDLDSFTVNTNGPVSYLEWVYTLAPVDLSHFVIRYHKNTNVTDWTVMKTIAANVPGSARSHTVPTRAGSYAIRAVDIAGRRSDPLFINASEVDANAWRDGEPLTVFSETEEPAWAGTRTGTYAQSDELRLDVSAFMSSWDALSLVPAIGGGGTIDEDTGLITGYYEFGETDLGGVFSLDVVADMTLGIKTSMNAMSGWANLSSVVTLAGDASDAPTDVEMQIARSIVDSATPTYEDWRAFDVGSYTARHVKFRVKLTTSQANISPSVTELTVSGSMEPRKLSGDDVASGAGAKSITFARGFYQKPAVGITAQDMQTGDFYVLSSISKTGFTVTFKNSGGSAVNRTFDWSAVGYGRSLT